MTPIRGDVWLINFDPAVGAEITKARPAVEVGNPNLGDFLLRIVVPLTSSGRIDGKPWAVPIKATQQNRLNGDTTADASQVKSVSIERFVHRIGLLTPKQMDLIVAAIALCVDYTP